MLLRPVSREAALSTRSGADGGGLFWGSQLGAGSGGARHLQAGAAGVFLRPDLRGAALAARQVITSPRQSESPGTTVVDDAVAWEDKEGKGRRSLRGVHLLAH